MIGHTSWKHVQSVQRILSMLCLQCLGDKLYAVYVFRGTRYSRAQRWHHDISAPRVYYKRIRIWPIDAWTVKYLRHFCIRFRLKYTKSTASSRRHCFSLSQNSIFAVGVWNCFTEMTKQYLHLSSIRLEYMNMNFMLFRISNSLLCTSMMTSKAVINGNCVISGIRNDFAMGQKLLLLG